MCAKSEPLVQKPKTYYSAMFKSRCKDYFLIKQGKS